MPELSLSELVRPELAELHAYAPVQGDFVLRLDANEAPALLAEHARARLAEVAARAAFERYPDARALGLRTAIARRAGVEADQVLVGVGSDEVIALLLTVLSRPRRPGEVVNVLTTTPSFVMYRMAARVRGMRVIEVPLDASWDLSADAMLRALELTPPNLVFLASPNNPTGTRPSPDRLERVIEAARGALVVIDEAYVDYADADCLALLARHENVALTRTLSKVGFAALRVGWLIARPELLRELDKARLPFNLSSLSQEMATLVLSELWSEVEALTGRVIAERERMANELAQLPGCSVTPSQANFLWLKTERPAGEVFDALVARKILVRSFHERGGRLAHQLRVTIGAHDQNELLLSALRGIV